MDTKVRIVLFLCVLCVLGGESALQAQQPDAGNQIVAGIEVRRDRFQYHFDNPSSFDTPVPVPHFFEQRYVADNIWAIVTIRYTARLRWETSLGATPQRTATADDYDTFFDPDGTVWVSGTTGGAAMRSFRISQTAEVARARGVRFVAGYRLRVDLADFQVGHKTETRNGVLVLATDVTSPETTSSQLREVLAGVSTAVNLATDWRLSIDGELTPLSIGRLAVRLPEKYADAVVFSARVAGASARVTLAWHHVRWPVELTIDGGRTWSYQPDARLAYDQFGVSLMVGRSW